MIRMQWKAGIFLILAATLITSSCSIERRISKSANKEVINAPALKTAHVGISVFEPASNKYWFNHQGDKYFVPASNTKIPTCYAAMKYLGDSLVGLRYGFPESFDLLAFQPTGDPTFLHQDFKQQPVFDFLKDQKKNKKISWAFMDTVWKEDKWGSGWSWNDYKESYMAERSSMPVFGNVINIKLKNVAERFIDSSLRRHTYNVFKTQTHYFDSLINSDCSYKDYLLASSNEIPERWMRAQERS